MTTLRISVATLAVATAILFSTAARAQSTLAPGSNAPATNAAPGQANIPVPTGPPVPTPGPSGTPVTFAPTQPLGKPMPRQPDPIATSVPTTSPDGNSTSFRGKHETFVVGDYLLQPKVYNELSHGEQSTQFAYALRGGGEFNLGDFPFMIEGEYRHYVYYHQAGLVTDPGRASQSFGTSGSEYDDDVDGHLGIKLLDPRIYLAVSYLNKKTGPTGPQVVGPGVGLEKLPDYEAPLGVYFSAYYYPNLVGQVGTGPAQSQLQTLRYRVLTYQLGFTVAPGKSPIFIDIGALGDRMTARGNAPSNETHLSPYAGIGFFGH